MRVTDTSLVVVDVAAVVLLPVDVAELPVVTPFEGLLAVDSPDELAAVVDATVPLVLSAPFEGFLAAKNDMQRHAPLFPVGASTKSKRWT